LRYFHPRLLFLKCKDTNLAWFFYMSYVKARQKSYYREYAKACMRYCLQLLQKNLGDKQLCKMNHSELLGSYDTKASYLYVRKNFQSL